MVSITDLLPTSMFAERGLFKIARIWLPLLSEFSEVMIAENAVPPHRDNELESGNS
jgi:hypothetical protein